MKVHKSDNNSFIFRLGCGILHKDKDSGAELPSPEPIAIITLKSPVDKIHQPEAHWFLQQKILLFPLLQILIRFVNRDVSFGRKMDRNILLGY